MVQEVKPVEEWSDADKAWLNKTPVQIRHLCEKHGRMVSQWVIDAGNLGYGLTQTARMFTGNRAAHQFVAVVQGVMNRWLDQLLRAEWGEKGPERFREIKQEFDTALALQDTGQPADGTRRSPGGIILDS